MKLDFLAREGRASFGLRWKITLPFFLLTLLLAAAGAAFVIRLLSETAEDRFLRQLADSGRQAADAVVRSEEDLLALERLIANTDGILEAVVGGDAESARARVLPLVINAEPDWVALIDSRGISVLTVRRRPDAPAGTYETLRGEGYYFEWPFVQQILQSRGGDDLGDKRAGVVTLPLSDRPVSVLFVAGPLEDLAGRVQGAVLVGRYADRLAANLAAESGANISLYAFPDGELIGTTLTFSSPEAARIPADLIGATLLPGSEVDPIRQLDIGGSPYREVMTPLEVRQGTESLGIIGISLFDSLAAGGDQPLPIQDSDTVLLVVAAAVGVMSLILLVGLAVAGSITRPLQTLAQATQQVATGNLDVEIPDLGNDELGRLARGFRQMLDALHRRPAPKQTPPEMSNGHPRAEPPTLPPVPVQVSGVHRGAFLSLEVIEPSIQSGQVSEAVSELLDGVLSAVATVIAKHRGGVISFDGAVLQATFGVWPRPLPASVCALQAVHAAMEVVDVIQAHNAGLDSPEDLRLAIVGGIASGEIASGLIGPKDHRLKVAFGPTVERAKALRIFARGEMGFGLVLGAETWESLGAAQDQFEMVELGRQRLPVLGRDWQLLRVRSRRVRLVNTSPMVNGLT